MTKKNRLRLHIVQFSSTPGEPLKTLKKLETLLLDLRPRPNDWLLLPEMWPALYDPANTLKQRVEGAFCFHWLKRYAQQHRCYLAGSMLEMPKKRAYNSAFLLGPQGKLLAQYRKIHLFPLSGEHLQFHPGRQTTLASVQGNKVGFAICFDLRFPDLFQKLRRNGAKLILVPSAWPRQRLEHFQTLLKARAIENQCYVAGVNKCGPEKDGMVFGGHSVVFDPWGNPVAKLGARKGIASAIIELAKVDKIRKEYPFLTAKKVQK